MASKGRSNTLAMEAAARMEAEGPGELSERQEAKLAELEGRLAIQPEACITEHALEPRRHRLIRWLRSEAFNVDQTFQKLHDHCQWWKEYPMDSFTEAHEFNEAGPLFVCGEDRWRRPVLIARPCVHLPVNKEESLLSARRCVYTLQRCVERMPPGVGKATVIYDAKGLQARNLDLTFSREVVSAIQCQFPERVTRILVINNHWSMAFFWSAISVLIDPVVKSKILFCGTDFREPLLHFVDERHAYFRYALKVQSLSSHEGAQVPLPKSSPYAPRWWESVMAKEHHAEDPTSPNPPLASQSVSSEDSVPSPGEWCRLETASTADTVSDSAKTSLLPPKCVVDIDDVFLDANSIAGDIHYSVMEGAPMSPHRRMIVSL